MTDSLAIKQNNAYVTGTTTSAAPEVKPVNSVYTVNQPQGVSVEAKNTSKIDKLLERICAEFVKLGITPEMIKNSGLLFRVTGLNQLQIENIDEQQLKRIEDSLKVAIKDATVDGKVDIEKVGKLANDYYIALNTGWSIEGFKDWNKNVEKSSLFTRLKNPNLKDCYALLKNYNSIDEVPPETLKKAVYLFFNEELIGKNKTDKSVKAQLQTFGRLLINTPENERTYFKDAIKSLVSENQIKGLEAVLISFDTPSTRTEWVDSWTVEDVKEIATTADVFGDKLSGKNVQKLTSLLTQYQSADKIIKNSEELHAETKKFLEDNKVILDRIAEKEAKGEELTEEEKAIKDLKERFYVPAKAGEISGTATNEGIESEIKTQILSMMNTNAYELGEADYKEILEKVSTYLEENKNLPVSNEEIINSLNEATKGNYNKVVTSSKEPLINPNVTEEEGSSLSSEGYMQTYSFKEIESISENVSNLIETYYSENQAQNEFVVEPAKVDKKETNSKTQDLRSAAFENASDINSYLEQTNTTMSKFVVECLMNLKDLGTSTEKWLIDLFDNSTTAMKVYLEPVQNSFSVMSQLAKKIDLSGCNFYGQSVSVKKVIAKENEKFIERV